MSTFQSAIEDARDEFQKLPDFSLIKEVTIIRDVYGKLSFHISVSSEIDMNRAGNRLNQRLGRYSADQIICRENNRNSFIQAVINEVSRKREPLTVYNPSAHTGCQWYIVERTIAKKAWMDHSGRHTPIWSYDDALNGTAPKVISFYSFKGGMGRTTALTAITYCLAKEGKNVLLVDADIEAPGLATIFLREDHIQKGIVDYFLERQTDSSFRWCKRMWKEYYVQAFGQTLSS